MSKKNDFEHRENTGATFRSQKRKSENSPVTDGTCNVGGKLYRMAGWKREAKSGTEYMSWAFTPLEEDEEYDDRPRKKGNGRSRSRDRDEEEDEEDSVPF